MREFLSFGGFGVGEGKILLVFGSFTHVCGDYYETVEK